MLAQSAFIGIDEPWILILVIAGPYLIAAADLGEVGLTDEDVSTGA